MNLIRIAEIADLESITHIYNMAVHSKFETADTTEVRLENRLDWFKSHDPAVFPVFVYEVDGTVVGWISLSPYREGRNALRYTIEISYYVHNDFKGQQIGSKLIETAITESKKLNYKTLFAIILDKNEPSIQLLIKYGFTKWGHMPDIADFNGIECGHVYYGRRL